MKREPNKDDHFKTKHTGEVKGSKLSHVRVKAYNPRLSWIFFHKICEIHPVSFKIKNYKVTELLNNKKITFETRGFNLSKKDRLSKIDFQILLFRCLRLIKKKVKENKKTIIKFDATIGQGKRTYFYFCNLLIPTTYYCNEPSSASAISFHLLLRLKFAVNHSTVLIVKINGNLIIRMSVYNISPKK